MNRFGKIFSLTIFGESHGNATGVVIDGCPAGISISADDFIADISRRKPGLTGTTRRIEEDLPEFMSGILNGKTTGSPITIIFQNKNVQRTDYEHVTAHPRPGHADFAAMKKFGDFADLSGGGHFSGRLTVALVAAGVIAKKIIQPIGIKAEIVEIGGSTDITETVQKAMAEKDSVGGVIRCVASNIPIGLGEPFFDSVESLISHLIFSIPAIRAIEFGSGFESAKMTGSQHNDAIISPDGKTQTNHSGGINGGITNGNDLIFRVAVKPASSIGKTQQTLNLQSNTVENLTITGRHDACIALRVPPVIEAATAIILADLMLLEQKIGRIFK